MRASSTSAPLERRGSEDLLSGSGGLFERLLRHVREGGESLRFVDGKLGEDLPIHLDLGHAETRDQAAVRKPVLACRGVDPHDPQLAEVALLGTAVPVGVDARVEELLVRGAEMAAARRVIALRLLQYFLTTLASGDASLDPWHRATLLLFTE